MSISSFRRVPSLFATSLILFMVGVLFFVSLLTAHRDLITLSILVFAVIGGLKAWSRFSSKKMTSHFILEKNRIFAGDQLVLKAAVENGKPIPVWLEVLVQCNSVSSLVQNGTALTGQGTLLWFQKTIFSWTVKDTRRGVCRIGPLRIASGDLFGFFQVEKETGEVTEALVYPKLVPLGPFLLPRRDFFGNPGGESPVDDPVYILGTTDYQNGRPAKYIHWKASARHYRLQEKVFESTEQEKILLVVDVEQFAAGHMESEFENILEVVASVAVRLDIQGCAVGLFTNGETQGSAPVVSVSRSLQQLTSILETLARLHMKAQGKLIDMLRAYDIPWGTSCIYFTFRENDSTDAIKAHFKRRKVPLIPFTFERASALRRDACGNTHVHPSEEKTRPEEVMTG